MLRACFRGAHRRFSRWRAGNIDISAIALGERAQKRRGVSAVTCEPGVRFILLFAMK